MIKAKQAMRDTEDLILSAHWQDDLRRQSSHYKRIPEGQSLRCPEIRKSVSPDPSRNYRGLTHRGSDDGDYCLRARLKLISRPIVSATLSNTGTRGCSLCMPENVNDVAAEPVTPPLWNCAVPFHTVGRVTPRTVR